MIVRLGIVLIVISWVVYGLIFIMAWIVNDWYLRVTIGGLLYLLSHLVFWLGMLMLGKEFFKQPMSRSLLKWLKSKFFKEKPMDE
ncbi:hypothetical protein Desor_4544 [Desulfosporosinus orientis DSM 765]|uniref:Uncharacterized protein n=1 Tax=Desulfosporosinus orientis (strain ATCC 19365 / DSM 765 / NCIMB 8382 / VKM B-1628 / Singapore I) TaxID=768706 RepID=G7W9N3_DESOD|nr:hypothetical protein Desor_4544 [Desulfosporosinus orientis DSM 765]